MKILDNFIKKTVVLVAFMGLLNGFSFAQYINDVQRETLRKEIEKLMKTYSDMSTFTTNDVSIDLNMINTFRGTFIETSKDIIFNDLLPTKGDGGKYLSPIAYTQFVQRYYPEGLDVVFNVEDIIIEPKGKKGVYIAIVKATKKIKGFYDKKRIHNFSGTIYFHIQASFVDTKVEKIAINLAADPGKHAQVQANKNLGGLYAGVSGTFNQSMFFTPMLTATSEIDWKQTPGQALSPTFELYWMITKGFGLGTGVRMSTYTSYLNLDNFNHELPNTINDIDGDPYYPYFEIPELEEETLIKAMDIPISLKFRGGKGKVGFHFDMGVIYSMISESTYSLTGTVTSRGRYPGLGNVTLQNIEEYGFYNNKSFDNQYPMEVPETTLSAFTSMGLGFVILRNIVLKVGVNAQVGITPIEYKQLRYSDDFFYKTTGKSFDEDPFNSIISYGVEFGLYYRFLK